MPKININGITRDMTAEEVAEMEQWAKEHPAPVDPMEEMQTRLEELEAANMELAAMIDAANTRAEEQEAALIELASMTESSNAE